MKKSKISTSFMLALALALSISFVASGKNVHAVESVGNQKQVIVVFKDASSVKNQSFKLKLKGKPTKEYYNVHSLKTNLSDNEITDLKKDPNVLSIEEDTKISMIQDLENTEVKDWGITTVGAESSWSSGYTGLGVKVAVIDTGVNTTHPDLETAIAGGVSQVSYTASYEDDNGHGTHVSGIIGARQDGVGIVGIAPEASIYAVKSLDSTGSGYISDIIGGIDWSIQNHMDIINMSLGSKSSSTALQTACDTAYSYGILVVAAAGNTGTAKVRTNADTINYPAKYASVIAVGATDISNNRAYFSSTGKELEVVAPGVNIVSDSFTGGYVTMSGTSMASPYVAGDLALLKQANPTYTNVQLRSLLDNNVTDLGTQGRDNLYGYGLIKAPVK